MDLVFQENVYSGWILRDPADHLVRGFEEPPQHTAPKSLRHAFKEYISFFTQTNHDLMADEDFTTLTRLEELQHELLRLPVDTRSKALFEHVSDQRERWYGK
ncbi:hypothetical protein A4G23_02561 [Streptomyces rubrolavendulae]|uniref:Uncharacterized protein n=1 Tax=Streptomyces rubrolavendulae TaxID=285473 RepID=A0A1D8G2Q1_9ACTN|nr:hypothetical protein A4G23_02561 [Streptomyces rubrolavendulae]